MEKRKQIEFEGLISCDEGSINEEDMDRVVDEILTVVEEAGFIFTGAYRLIERDAEEE